MFEEIQHTASASAGWHAKIAAANALARSYQRIRRSRQLEQRWQWNDPESQWNYQARTGLQAPANQDLRRTNPNWGGMPPVKHNGFSNAHSAQVEIERRHTDGLAFQGWLFLIRLVIPVALVAVFVTGILG